LSYECHNKGKGKGRYSSSWRTPPQSYGTSLAIWDHTVLPATRHKWTRPAWSKVFLPYL